MTRKNDSNKENVEQKDSCNDEFTESSAKNEKEKAILQTKIKGTGSKNVSKASQTGRRIQILFVSTLIMIKAQTKQQLAVLVPSQTLITCALIVVQ